jgi:hypothetical protein
VELATKELEATVLLARHITRFCHPFHPKERAAIKAGYYCRGIFHETDEASACSLSVDHQRRKAATPAVLAQLSCLASKFTWHKLGAAVCFRHRSTLPAGDLNTTTSYACRFEFGN